MNFTVRTTTAPTVEYHGLRITPEARVVNMRLPFGGLVWNRPRAVIVEQDGAVRRLPIVNITRLGQAVVWVSLLAAVYTAGHLFTLRKEQAA